MATTLINPYAAVTPFAASAMDPASVAGANGPAFAFTESNRRIKDSSGGAGDHHMRSLAGHATGKRRVEVTGIVNGYAARPAIGVCNIGNRGAWLGSNANAIALNNSGDGVWYNGVNQVSGSFLPALFIGSQVAVEVDADGQLIRWKSNGNNQTWSQAIPFAGPYYFCIGTAFINDEFRINFGNVAWAIAPTAGFEQGWAV
jgi:hypothetical protein